MSELTLNEFSTLYLGQISPEIRGFENHMEQFANEKTVEKLYRIADRLIDNGKRFNLTSILDPAEIVRKHIIDSIQPAGILMDLGIYPLSLLDVGTGGGFPLLPMAAVFSEDRRCSFTGLDATKKKISHIRETAEYAGLSRVNAVEGRAEELSHGEMREKFTLCTARAVAALPMLTELCAPFIENGGFFAAMKAHSNEEIEQSLPTASLLGLEKYAVIDYFLPGGDARSLIVFRKIKPTPKKYPRRYAEILKQPPK